MAIIDPLEIPPFLRRAPSGRVPPSTEQRTRFITPKAGKKRLWRIRDFGGAHGVGPQVGRVVARTRAAALRRARERFPSFPYLTVEPVS